MADLEQWVTKQLEGVQERKGGKRAGYVLLALDFDYTLKIKREGKLVVRGKGSRDFLSRMKEKGCELMVITGVQSNSDY